MDDYVTKPLRDRALQDALARWIAKAPSHAAVLAELDDLGRSPAPDQAPPQ
jgi:hypothetical protein